MIIKINQISLCSNNTLKFMNIFKFNWRMKQRIKKLTNIINDKLPFRLNLCSGGERWKIISGIG
jgi:hypothetical protein